MRSLAGGIGTEGVVAGTLGHALCEGPQDRVEAVILAVHILEREFSLRLPAKGPVQERDAVAAGHDFVRVAASVAVALGDTC